MKKLVLMLMLTAFVVPAPFVMARDMNSEGLRQSWRDQVNLEKQQARIQGLRPDTVVRTPQSAAKPSTAPKLRAENCACEACKL